MDDSFLKKRKAKKQRRESLKFQIKELQEYIDELNISLKSLECSKHQIKDNFKWFEVKQKQSEKKDIKIQINELKRHLMEAESKIKLLEKEKNSLDMEIILAVCFGGFGVIMIVSIILGVIFESGETVNTNKIANTSNAVVEYSDTIDENTTLQETEFENNTSISTTITKTEYNGANNEDTSKTKNNTTFIETTANNTTIASSVSSLPKYNGNAYTTINSNKPYFTSSQKKNKSAFETYSDLDTKGRCGVAFANICKQIMPTEERGQIGSVKPSGWQLVKYDFIDGKYLYNRCHLIGYQLAGENANVKNLITGTRYLNIQGMLPFENMVADYVKETNNHVLYRVTPVFVGNELVARGVQIEAYSVEDSGNGICFNVYCFNVQPGVIINYSNGNSALNGQIPTTKSSTKATTKITTKTTTKARTTEVERGKCSYVGNLSSKKFHKPSCGSVTNMKNSNKVYFYCSREEIMKNGYKPCGNCKP